MHQSRRITVMVADDHAEMLKVVSTYLRQHFKVLAVVSSGGDLMRAVTEELPDVIVADIDMPMGDGVSCMLDLKELGVKVPFVLLSTETTGAQNLIEMGAAAYVHKYDIFADLIKAVEVAADGGTFVSRSAIN